MKPLANSKSSRITPCRISCNLSNFPILEIRCSHKYNIPQSLFTLSKNIGVYPKRRTPSEIPGPPTGNFPRPPLVLASKRPLKANQSRDHNHRSAHPSPKRLAPLSTRRLHHPRRQRHLAWHPHRRIRRPAWQFRLRQVHLSQSLG